MTHVCVMWIGSGLVQLMTCRLFAIKALSKPMLGCCNCTLRNKHSGVLIKIKNYSWKIICEMAAILSRGDELKRELSMRVVIRYPMINPSPGSVPNRQFYAYTLVLLLCVWRTVDNIWPRIPVGWNHWLQNIGTKIASKLLHFMSR